MPPATIKPRGVVCEAPVRIDFSHGGGSDLPGICHAIGGRAVNFAAQVEQLLVRSEIQVLREPYVRLSSAEIPSQLTLDSNSTVLVSSHSTFGLHRAALAASGLVSPDAKVSDLIDRIGGGIAIHTRAGFPVGSGLGVSSILAATIIHALRVLAGLSSEHADLIERSLRAEQLLGSRGGWQDVAGGIYGGIKSIVSDAGAPSEPQVEFVNVNSEVRAELRDRLVLCYTGEAHFSGDVISTLIRDFENRTEPQWSTRRSIALLDQPIVESLQSGDFNQLGNLLREFWESFLILVPEAQTLVITRIIEEVGDLTSGYKACGAGGGGCFMLVANEGLRGLVNQKLESMFRSSNIQSARILDWEFDEIGLRTDSYT